MPRRINAISELLRFPVNPGFDPAIWSRDIRFKSLPKVPVAHGVGHQPITINRKCSLCDHTAAHVREENTQLNAVDLREITRLPHDGIAEGSPLAGPNQYYFQVAEMTMFLKFLPCVGSQ